jgi:hypothetical protein
MVDANFLPNSRLHAILFRSQTYQEVWIQKHAFILHKMSELARFTFTLTYLLQKKKQFFWGIIHKNVLDLYIKHV